MELLRFRRFHETDLPVYAAWFSDDELARRAPFPDEKWLAESTSGDGVVTDVASLDADGAPVAVIRHEEEGDGGVTIFIAVAPSRRRERIAQRVLVAFASRAALTMKVFFPIGCFSRADSQGLTSTPPLTGSRQPVVAGKVSGKPLRDRTAR